MHTPLNEAALRQLFTEARTLGSTWLDKPVTDDTLHAIWDLAKWGPTAFNALPGRFVFVKTAEGKEKLRPALSEGNLAKTLAAPATIIVAMDEGFYERLPALFPVFPGARDIFAGNAAAAETAAFRNATLQGAYVLMAARALGLDCGPMSGFDNAKVDEAFFAGTRIKSNFLINIGYADVTKAYPRGPRPDFAEDCRIV